MNTDRELLELAAKAAGIKIGNYVEGIDNYYSPWNGADAFYLESDGYWNPLTDDGDALRLAVDLDIPVARCALHKGDGISSGYIDTHFARESFSGGRSEQQEATRRAIVRAAAEIGRAMT